MATKYKNLDKKIELQRTTFDYKGNLLTIRSDLNENIESNDTVKPKFAINDHVKRSDITDGSLDPYMARKSVKF